MTKFQKTTLYLSLVLFLLAPYNGECSESTRRSQTGKRFFATRFVFNLFINGAITALSFQSADKEEVATVNDIVLVGAFFANSIAPVILFQNYDSLTPFSKTIAYTGGAAVISGLLAIPLPDGPAGIVLLVNWFFGMPYIASKTNHIIYLKRYKKRHIELNLL